MRHRFSTAVLAGVALSALAAAPASAQLSLVSIGGGFTPGNVATRVNATAFAKDLLPGFFPIHQIPNLNDGRYGNSNSWIGNSDPSFAGINLGGLFTVNRVAWSSENVPSIIGDRRFGTYTVQYTTEANPNALTANWNTLGSVVYNGATTDPSRRHLYEFNPVTATGLRLITDSPSGGFSDLIRVDELEVYGPTDIAAVTRDDFTGGFRSDLPWSVLSRNAAGATVGTRDNALMNVSGGTLNLDSRANSNLFGDNNAPVDLPNLAVSSVPNDWYVETSVRMNLADLTNLSAFTQANLVVYRDTDFFSSIQYTNLVGTQTPQSGISTNVQTVAGDSNFGGFFGTAFTPNSSLDVRLRIERKTNGVAPGFVLGGNTPGIYLGFDIGNGWVTYGNVVNNSGDANRQRTFDVLSQVAPGYRIGLAANGYPGSGPAPVARFDYLETNLGVAASGIAPEPASAALALLGLLAAPALARRRRS